MAEVINTNVFDATKEKFVNFAGLDYFWTIAKNYIDGVDTAMDGRVSALETTVGKAAEGENPATGLVKQFADLKATVDALGDIEGGTGISGMIDAKIADLDVDDAAVEGQYVSAVSEADGKISVTRAALPDYTNTYDAKGAAAQALTDAKAYTDTVVGAWTDGETAGTGLRKEIEDKVAAVAADAKSYSVVAVTGDELAGLGANVKEAYKLVDEDSAKSGEYIKIYKDSALQKVELVNQELQFTYLLADGTASMVPVSVATFLAESEFGDGLQVNSESGIVSVKVDAASEAFLTVGADGVKLSGVQGAIDSAAGQALTDAKAYTDTVVGTYTSEGVEASGLRKEIEDNEKVTAESLNDLNTRVETLEGKDTYVKADVDKQISDAQAAAIAQAKLDAAAALADYYKKTETYSKTEVDGLLSTNSAADQAYAKTYTDQLFQSITFASNSDIDGIFNKA